MVPFLAWYVAWPLPFVPGVGGDHAMPLTGTWYLHRLGARKGGRVASRAIPVEESLRSGRARRWRAVAMGIASFWTYFRATPAWAQVARKYATRSEERKAQLITLGILALFFAVAFLNSKKEDSSEEERIKSEVQRLVRLKAEFEDQEGNNEGEQLSDDGLAAALRAAQEKMSEDAGDEAGAKDSNVQRDTEGEGSDSEDDKDDVGG